MKENEIICWWSGGATSAIACKYALEKYNEARLIFIETGSHHPDTQRFKSDCERWYNRPIETIQNSKFKDHYDVCEKFNFINSPRGSCCTTQLKRRVREKFEKNEKISMYVWGFEEGEKEEKRASRLIDTIPYIKHYFPLIENRIDKKNAIDILVKNNIDIPMMYKLGYPNNNCIGCVKGGMAYWNKIRVDFPDVFDSMKNLERKIGRSCIKDVFLDELKPHQGRGLKPFVDFCGATGEGCEIQQYWDNKEENK